MTQQDIWGDTFQLHNFGKAVPILTYEILAQEMEEPVIEPIVEMPKPVERPTEKPKSEFRTLSRNMFFCLPARLEEKIDKLYGEKIMRVVYDNPFRFQGAIVQQSDVQCLIWTTVPQVTISSVVYHPETMRWWKVSDIQNETDGRVLTSVISDVQPDFSSLA